jgi:hypothetical protein
MPRQMLVAPFLLDFSSSREAPQGRGQHQKSHHVRCARSKLHHRVRICRRKLEQVVPTADELPSCIFLIAYSSE